MSDQEVIKPEDHKILVVEDEQIVRFALEQTIKRNGYQVKSAPSALDALPLLDEDEYSVVLSDHLMPRMTGLEFLAEVKTLQPHASRILITAVMNYETIIDAINKGEIFRFIVKPWTQEELLTTVKNGCQRYHLIVSNEELKNQALAMNEKLLQANASLDEKVLQLAERNTEVERLNVALEKNWELTSKMCLETIQSFYPSLGYNARRVHEICLCIAKDLGLSHLEEQVLSVAAHLHDIGLVGVPREVIRRWRKEPEILSDAEWGLIRQHPLIGEEIAKYVHPYDAIGKLIRGHHERFDGSGYPDGLSGDEISRENYILSLAVAFADLQMDPDDAVEEILKQNGTAFHPEIVRSFSRSFHLENRMRSHKEMLLSELTPGMVLAEGVHSGKGILLIPEGHTLNEAYIQKLKNHDRHSPIANRILVYC